MENRTELAAFGASFVVIFFNGYTNVHKGNILVYPYLSFNDFKALVSRKLGTPPHLILTYLVRWKDVRSSPKICFRVPIDESSDFTAITKERDCFVLAILNLPMKNGLLRSGERGKAIAVEAEAKVPEKTSLNKFLMNALNVDVPIPVGLRHWNYDSQLQDMQREKHMKAVETATETAISSEMGAVAAKSVVCEQCAAAKKEGRLADFHLCVLDPVVVAFRTKAGPIQRPPKKHLGA